MLEARRIALKIKSKSKVNFLKGTCNNIGRASYHLSLCMIKTQCTVDKCYEKNAWNYFKFTLHFLVNCLK